MTVEAVTAVPAAEEVILGRISPAHPPHLGRFVSAVADRLLPVTTCLQCIRGRQHVVVSDAGHQRGRLLRHGCSGGRPTRESVASRR